MKYEVKILLSRNEDCVFMEVCKLMEKLNMKRIKDVSASSASYDITAMCDPKNENVDQAIKKIEDKFAKNIVKITVSMKTRWWQR